MPSENSVDLVLKSCLRGEEGALNAQLPKHRKTLKRLLAEEHPHVVCGDGTPHYMKRKELEYLKKMTTEEEQEALLLPIIVEVLSEGGALVIRSPDGIEEKIVSTILKMTVTSAEKAVTLFKPQLVDLRKHLKTSTQYAFLY